ncbi:MAG: heme-binding protein [Actinomycetota bacterium]
MAALAGGKVVPTAGGVLLHDGSGEVIEAAGVSGDTSDNDEECALHGIEAVGLTGRR